MTLNRVLTWKSLSDLWSTDKVKSLETKDQKYAIISDTHMGDGGKADDFHRNVDALRNSLKYYFDKGFTLILLGDIEELWQFDLHTIVGNYQKTVYDDIKRFGNDRIHRIFGNHDNEWAGLEDPTKSNGAVNRLAEEALKLKGRDGKEHLLLVHGHQGSIDSDKFAWFSRFFVRLFKGIEPFAVSLGLYSHPSATKSPVAKDYEQTYYQWAKKNKVIVICGHSHRAIFGSKAYTDLLRENIAKLKAENLLRGKHTSTRRRNLREIDRLEEELEDEKSKGRVIEPTDPNKEPLPCYFNSGCGLYTDGITVIEIEDDDIRLVKWNKDEIKGKTREVFNSGSLNQIIKSVIS